MITSAPPKVFDSAYSRRAERDRQMMAENRIPDARDIDTIADGAVKREAPAIVSEKTPRYRGAANTADTGNTGIVSTNRGSDLIMNIGDRVLFTGASGWITAFLYEWRGKPEEGGNGWVSLPREASWERYLDAVSDLTEGAPEGVFSTAFIKNLFAQTINADLVRAKLRLQVGEDDSYIEINGQDNYIQSSNFAEGQDGFRINLTATPNSTTDHSGGTLTRTAALFMGALKRTKGFLEGVFFLAHWC